MAPPLGELAIPLENQNAVPSTIAGISQLPVTLAPRDLKPASGLHGH